MNISYVIRDHRQHSSLDSAMTRLYMRTCGMSLFDITCAYYYLVLEIDSTEYWYACSQDIRLIFWQEGLGL